jgi:hypothetical protein
VQSNLAEFGDIGGIRGTPRGRRRQPVCNPVPQADDVITQERLASDVLQNTETRVARVVERRSAAVEETALYNMAGERSMGKFLVTSSKRLIVCGN